MVATGFLDLARADNDAAECKRVTKPLEVYGGLHGHRAILLYTGESSAQQPCPKYSWRNRC